MALDRSFVQQNRAATDRLRDLAARLTDQELLTPVGEHWTVAITLVHLAFWDRRAMDALAASEQAGGPVIPTIDLSVNDLSLPLWAAIPPREAARLAVEAAEQVDARLASLPDELLETVYAQSPRLIVRARHRNEHLDEAEQALAS